MPVESGAEQSGSKYRKSSDRRKFQRAVGRVLIALSFKTSAGLSASSDSSSSSTNATSTTTNTTVTAAATAAATGSTTSGDDLTYFLSGAETEQLRASSFSGGFYDSFVGQDGGGGGGGEGGGGGGRGRSYSWKYSPTTMTMTTTTGFSGANECWAPRGFSDESDQEPPRPRRERRKAICESKVLGLCNTQDDDTYDGSETSISTMVAEADQDGGETCERQRSLEDVSGGGGCGGRPAPDGGQSRGGDATSLEQRPSLRRRRAVPPPLIKRNTIADFANTKAYQASTVSLLSISDQDKKTKSTFSLLKRIDRRSHHSKDNLCQLSEVLHSIKSSEFNDENLLKYKDVSWVKLLPKAETDVASALPETERKRREAVWELFTSECVFLFDHLMVLKHCFMEPLKRVQVEGHLMFTEPQELFGNLDELCYVSYTFCYDFLQLLMKDTDETRFGSADVLVQGLKRLCELTRDGEVYHDYCLNYPKASCYLDQLRKRDDFIDFEKWCEQDARCHRLQLTDLLISPLQHWTKVPLLLSSIRRYTISIDEQLMLTETLGKLEQSLKMLEAKMKSVRNYERLHELQQQIVWMPITELEPRTFIPEFLKSALSRQPCARILSSPRRNLIHEGPVTLIEVSKAVDMYLFLFDDILLLTKVKKSPKKRSIVVVETTVPYAANSRTHTPTPGDGGGGGGCAAAAAAGGSIIFVVHRQPLALDRFTVLDIRPVDAAANGLKNAFVLLQLSRFQQVLGVFTLQTPTEANKTAWLTQLHSAQERFRESLKRNGFSSSRGSSNEYLATTSDDMFSTSASGSPSLSTFLSTQTTNATKNHLHHLSPSSSTRSSCCHPGVTSTSGCHVTSSGCHVTSSGGHVTSSGGHVTTQRNTSCPDTRGMTSNRDHDSGSCTDLQPPLDSCVQTSVVSESDQLHWTSSTNGDTAVNKDNDKRYLTLPPSVDSDSEDGQVPRSRVIPRSRPSSLHAKRRGMLKAIREKSLSIDLTTVPN